MQTADQEIRHQIFQTALPDKPCRLNTRFLLVSNLILGYFSEAFEQFWRWLSTITTFAAYREAASIPKAPLPLNKSNTVYRLNPDPAS